MRSYEENRSEAFVVATCYTPRLRRSSHLPTTEILRVLEPLANQNKKGTGPSDCSSLASDKLHTYQSGVTP